MMELYFLWLVVSDGVVDVSVGFSAAPGAATTVLELLVAVV